MAELSSKAPKTLRNLRRPKITQSMSSATAPGKIILFGEHAVVYGQPALAMPVEAVEARAMVETNNSEESIELVMPDLDERLWLYEADDLHPQARVVRDFFKQSPDLAMRDDGLRITLTSTIPMAGGMGSGAAVSAALFRALARHYNVPELATDEVVSQMTYEIERLYHGTPSGIDNTVVTYNKPVYFVRDLFYQDVDTYNYLLGGDGYMLFMPGTKTFDPGADFTFLIADSGIEAPTAESVRDVRYLWLTNRFEFESLFIRCGQIANQARQALDRGDHEGLGSLMNFNQHVLQDMTVSSPEIENLVNAARKAGAMGAKLSGGGRGGNVIALVDENSEEEVRKALLKAGAKSVLKTVLSA